jgi:hypothetical protein
MGEENRRIPKANVRWPVIVERPEGDIEGVITRVTPKGGFVHCSKPPKLNEVFDMTIDAPDNRFMVKAEVIWSNIYGRDDEISPRGMGIRFLKIRSADRLFIARVLADQGVKKVAKEYLKTLDGTVEDIKSGAS